MDLKVIGAGLGRTGTTSLKQAFEILELGPCHHMSEAMQQPREVVSLWEDVAAGNLEALKRIYRGYHSTLDYPGCTHFATFLAWNPHAKVVLSVRNSPEQWASSAGRTIFSRSVGRKILLQLLFLLPLNNLYYLQYIQKACFRAHAENPLHSGCDLARLYREWEEHVRAAVPAERLLVYNVAQGWEPLCAFLEVPVPEVAFPRQNDGNTYQKTNHFQSSVKWICFLVVVVMVAAIALGLTFGLHH